jgi:adenosylcobinamide kinase/adenosylcobinamide-phosphate guanylyltransferase
MQPHHELILGGQKSGKTARAEHMAAHWLAAAQAPTQTSAENIATAPQAEAQPRRAIYIATAQPWDEEMRQRIARHQSERAQRVPSMVTLETTDLPAALHAHSNPHTLLVIDCLTLWLTHLLMPMHGKPDAAQAQSGITALLQALKACQAQVYLVSNEIGLGLIPLGQENRAFVDALGMLNQRVAAACSHVTLMAAGLPLPLKRP